MSRCGSNEPNLGVRPKKVLGSTLPSTHLVFGESNVNPSTGNIHLVFGERSSVNPEYQKYIKRYHKHRSFFEIFEPANRDLFFLGPGFWGKMSSFVSDLQPSSYWGGNKHLACDYGKCQFEVWSNDAHLHRSFHLVGNPVLRSFATVCRTLVSSHPPSNLSSRSNRSISPPEARCGWEEYSKLSLPSMPDTLLECNDAPKKWSCFRPILVKEKQFLLRKSPKWNQQLIHIQRYTELCTYTNHRKQISYV